MKFMVGRATNFYYLNIHRDSVTMASDMLDENERRAMAKQLFDAAYELMPDDGSDLFAEFDACLERLNKLVEKE